MTGRPGSDPRHTCAAVTSSISVVYNIDVGCGLQSIRMDDRSNQFEPCNTLHRSIGIQVVPESGTIYLPVPNVLSQFCCKAVSIANWNRVICRTSSSVGVW